MNLKLGLVSLSILLVAVGLGTSRCTREASSSDSCVRTNPYETTSTTATDFVHANGNSLYVGSQQICLRGVNFQNDMLLTTGGQWTRDPTDDTSTPITDWYSETHVQRARAIGFNVIRFMLNYRLFEDNGSPFVYKQSGWDFVDQYIQWARANDMYLILDIHIPQQGMQTFPIGASLWDESSNQARLRALWKEIATRYVNEPTIAAYDLVNEPSPSVSVSQWATLAQQIIDDIRSVDTNHLIIVEQVATIVDSSGNANPPNLSDSFITVNDTNLMYDFHFYSPMLNYSQFRFCGGTENYPVSSVQEQAVDGNSYPCDSTFLSSSFDSILSLLPTNVPINVGEFAGGDETTNLFALAGGPAYIRDLLNLLNERGLNWQYYSFNEFHTASDLAELNTTYTEIIESVF